ncbi:MAG: hypothetical protein ACI4EI_00600 [Muricoprocola sp.]
MFGNYEPLGNGFFIVTGTHVNSNNVLIIDLVKRDREVALNYMKTIEWEEMLSNQGIELGIERGIEQGRSQGQANTERERSRADSEAQRANLEAARADQAEKELVLLKKKLASLKAFS